MDKKLTVFLTIGTGIVARNLLNNRFYQKLKKKHVVVFFTPLYNDAEFKERFGGPDVYFEDLIHRKLTRMEQFFISLHKALIYNESVKIKSFYSISSTMRQDRTFGKIVKNYAELLMFGLFLSKVSVLRSLLKFLDRAIYTAEYYDLPYLKYNPDLVFITNVGSDDEVYLLRSGMRRTVPSIGMTKSWDNFSKIGCREWVGKIIVWSDYMKDEVLKFQGYKEEDIVVIGVPQFDVLSDVKETHTREDFIKTYGLDPHKKTILFGQSNPMLCPDDAYICEILKKWIIAGGRNYQLLIRPHFRHKNAEKSFLPLVDNQTVFIDLQNEASNFTSGAWDLSIESQVRRALSLRYCDLVVNSASTLILDTVTAGTHYLSYAFDRDKETPYGKSIKRIFDLLWYVGLKQCGFEELMVHSKEELLAHMEQILSAPVKRLPEIYPTLISRFCFRADGKAGERLFNVVESSFGART